MSGGRGGSTLIQAMQKRRKDLRESIADSTMEMSSRDDVQMLSADDGDIIDEMETINPIEELQDAENLVEKLQNDREERKKELFKSLEPAEEADSKPVRQRKIPKATASRDVGKIPTIPETSGNDKDVMVAKRPSKGKKDMGPMSMEAAVMAVKTGHVSEKAPANLNASIRERIKKKMLEAKEKAEETMREEVEKDPDKDFPARKLRGMRARDLATRFDEPSILTKEELEEDKMLQESIAAKSKWKEAFKAIKAKKSHLPSAEEAYDFFTRNFDPEPGEEQSSPPDEVEDEDRPGPSSPRSGEEQTPKSSRGKKKEKKEDEKPLLSEHFLDHEDWKDNPSEMRGAEYVPLRVREEAEKDIYFVPSSRYIDVQQKIPKDTAPRYLEDEGFYVGVKPNVSQRNRNLMEHRLMNRKDKGEQWFGADGSIKALPDPLKDMPSRPKIVSNEEREPALQTIYKKAIVTEYDNRYIDGLGDEMGGRYQLDVDVNTLVFTHHSLFSKEHVLASRLCQMYDQYLKRSQREVAQYLTDKLQALKVAVTTLYEQLLQMHNADQDSSTVQEYNHRLQDYKHEIRQTRRLRDYELQHDRQLLLSIIKTWHDIKALRDTEECTNTPVKLGVRKEESNKKDDEALWRAEIEDAVSDMQEDYEEDYQGELARYKEALTEWKEYMKQKKARKKKKKQRGSGESLEDLDEADDNEGESSKPLQEIPKPAKPAYSFDEKESRQKVKKKMLAIRRKPGESILTPELSNAAVITPTSDCPRAEQARRTDMHSCKCFVKVLFNNKEVSRTGARWMSSDFTLHFGDIFNIQIMHWPESVKLQVFETGTLANTLLAEIYAVVPDTQVTQDKVQLESLEFGSDQRVAYEHSAVGSGQTFHLGNGDATSEPMQLFTQGTLLASVSWGLAEDNTPLVPPSASNSNVLGPLKHLDAVAAIGATGLVDPERLAKWVSEARLDPNDPANANLLHMIRDFQGEGGKRLRTSAQFFRLEQLQEEFNFVSDEVLESSKRFRLIQLREKETPEFRSFKMVPMVEKEIPGTVFAEYEKRKHMEEQGILEEDMDPHRAAVAKFLGKVHERVMARFRAANHQYSLSDVVNEDQVPDVSMLSSIILRLLEPKRPLRPVRKERKTVTAQNLSGLQVNLLINIERAIEIPVRKSSAIRSDGQSTITSSVRPFVEVVFQQSVTQTSVADGSNPNWNEELVLPFQAPNNDYSPATLQGVKDIIYFNLFDEVVIDMLQDDRDRATNVHQRMERRWLGSISMPFSTVYFQNRVSGTFRLNAPSVLLGYDRSPDSMARNQGNQYSATYLSLFITIEPPLTSPEPLKEKFESNEEEKLLSYAENYQTSLLTKFPKREVTTTVLDINGKSVFVTRYFRPIKPPGILLGEANNPVKLAESIAHYVSLIPFISDSVVYPGLCDIWSTCDQFLQMLQGDEEEHAVLLCNYFLYLGKKTWIINGTAIPEGPTSYVLTSEDTGYWIWNPSSGEHYSQFDSYCPLKSVGCVINQENIWANIQLNEDPTRINFNMKDPKSWQPLFSKNYPSPGLSSVQPSELIYDNTDQENIAVLQDKIEKKLRECIMQWRSRFITRWNRYCQQIFRQVLSKLEMHRGGSEEHQSELAPILQTYNMCGFPLNMSYTEMKDVIEKVHSTGVHINESGDVEFALAVHIHPYPSNVLSVWVYIASLTRKR